MGRILSIVLAFGGLVGISTAASAESLLPYENPITGTRIAEYMSLERVQARFRGMVQAHSQAVGSTCGVPGDLALNEVYAVLPVVLEDDLEHPSSGVWVYRFSVERCGERQGLQAIAAAVVPGEAPRLVYLQAGDTLADPTVQKEMLNGPGHATAFAQTGLKTCDSFMVVDTTITTPPHDLPVTSAMGRDLDGQAKTIATNAGIPRQIDQTDAVVVWEEQWDLRYCGQNARISVDFWENPYIHGAVGYSVADGGTS